MKSRERTVHFYDLKVISSLHGFDVAPIPMATDLALELARSRFGIGMAGKPWKDGDRHITLDDWQFNPARREHYLVVSCADPKLSDVTFKHLPTGTARMAGKEKDEAIDFSAHVILKLGSQPTEPALMLMTGGSGVSASKVATMLGKLVKAMAADPKNKPHFTRDHPSGAVNAKLKLQVKLEVAGHQSRWMQNILRTGHIEEIELITDMATEFDVDKGFHVTRQVLKVEPASDVGDISLTRLKNLLTGSETHQAHRARISFKEHTGAATESHTFHTNDLEQAFVRKDRIKFDTDILSRYSSVSLTVIDKMRSVL